MQVPPIVLCDRICGPHRNLPPSRLRVYHWTEMAVQPCKLPAWTAYNRFITWYFDPINTWFQIHGKDKSYCTSSYSYFHLWLAGHWDALSRNSLQHALHLSPAIHIVLSTQPVIKQKYHFHWIGFRWKVHGTETCTTTATQTLHIYIHTRVLVLSMACSVGCIWQCVHAVMLVMCDSVLQW